MSSGLTLTFGNIFVRGSGAEGCLKSLSVPLSSVFLEQLAIDPCKLLSSESLLKLEELDVGVEVRCPSLNRVSL